MGLGGAGPLCSWGFLELSPCPHTDSWETEVRLAPESCAILSAGLSFPTCRMGLD